MASGTVLTRPNGYSAPSSAGLPGLAAMGLGLEEEQASVAV